MTNSTIFKQYCISIISLAILSIIMSCGPTKKELAIRREKLEDQRIELENRRSLLAKKVQQRIEAGEQPPTKIKDPGYPLANCKCTEGFLNDRDRVGITSDGLLVASISWTSNSIYTCVNANEAGQMLLSYREWYCEGEDKSCVLSAWKDGQPTFGEHLYYRIKSLQVDNNSAVFTPVQTRNSK